MVVGEGGGGFVVIGRLTGGGGLNMVVERLFVLLRDVVVVGLFGGVGERGIARADALAVAPVHNGQGERAHPEHYGSI